MTDPVTIVSGRAYPWGAKNIDTDIIIPAHWLKTTTREGLGKGAFETVLHEIIGTIDVARQRTGIAPKCGHSGLDLMQNIDQSGLFAIRWQDARRRRRRHP